MNGINVFELISISHTMFYKHIFIKVTVFDIYLTRFQMFPNFVIAALFVIC